MCHHYHRNQTGLTINAILISLIAIFGIGYWDMITETEPVTHYTICGKIDNTAVRNHHLTLTNKMDFPVKYIYFS